MGKAASHHAGVGGYGDHFGNACPGENAFIGLQAALVELSLIHISMKLKHILFIAITAVLFGVFYLGTTYAGTFLTGVLTPMGLGILGYEPFYGIWFMAAVFITYVIQKPGVGLIAEMLASFLEVLMGNMFGPCLLYTSTAICTFFCCISRNRWSA